MWFLMDKLEPRTFPVAILNQTILSVFLHDFLNESMIKT